MAKAYDLRPAVPTDAPGLIAVIEAAYAPFAASGIQLPPVAEGIADDIANHDVWVATQDSAILGGIVVTFVDGAHIANLAVHPDAGGRGIGQALIARAVVTAKGKGFAEIQLATHVEMTGTQSFYLAQGWRETGRSGNKVYMTIDIS